MTPHFNITCARKTECAKCDCLHKRMTLKFARALPDRWIGILIRRIDADTSDASRPVILITWFAQPSTEQLLECKRCARHAGFATVHQDSDTDLTPQDCYDTLDEEWRGEDMEDLWMLVHHGQSNSGIVQHFLAEKPEAKNYQPTIMGAIALLRTDMIYAKDML